MALRPQASATALVHRCHQERLPSASTNVVEFVLQPETLSNQLVTLVKETTSTIAEMGEYLDDAELSVVEEHFIKGGLL